jgi:hypothetical protein
MSATYFFIGLALVLVGAVGSLTGGIEVKNNWGWWNPGLTSPLTKTPTQQTTIGGNSNTAYQAEGNITVLEQPKPTIAKEDEGILATVRELVPSVPMCAVKRESPQFPWHGQALPVPKARGFRAIVGTVQWSSWPLDPEFLEKAGIQ